MYRYYWCSRIDTLMNCKNKINQAKNFWSDNLKKRLEKDSEFAPLIQFSKIEGKGCLSFWLIFSANLLVEKAVAASYLPGTKDDLHDTATYLHKLILTAFRKSKEMAWSWPVNHSMKN